MSGDVQPRKRKDKKRKKDDLGVEEPRGTAAVFGEGDVFMHSQHEHGTGGHWCAKIIFFSLLAILITLIGLIILENRGLTELEANSVETRYSGVLEGWLEDAPDDDHHDEHTLELNHPEEEEHEDEVEDTEVELERIEREIPDEEPISMELPALPEEDNDDDNSQEASNEVEASREEDEPADEIEEEFLEADDDEPPIERITAPAGRPYVEVEEEVSSEQPPDTLTEEEEYEKQQEELRREKEKSSHMWLKLSVGGALLVATHAVLRRATAPRDDPATEERTVREETPLLDRRMTLIPEETYIPAPKTIQESYQPIVTEVVSQKVTPPLKTPTPPPQEEIEDEEEEDKQSDEEVIEPTKVADEQKDKEIYSDEEELEEEEEEEVVVKKETPKENTPKVEEKTVPTPEPEEDDPDDVEIIDDEQLEEELEEEEEDDISDVDDVELLTRLEAKYGRLPEPERPGQKHKDGGNSIEDEWPGEPSDAFWRQELDSVEDQLRQDWLN